MGLISRVSSRTYRYSTHNIKSTMSSTKKEKAEKKLLDPKQMTKIFEDDDEFEEFPEDAWDQSEEAKTKHNQNIWEENWDDDDVEDDFSQKLKELLAKKGHAGQ